MQRRYRKAYKRLYPQLVMPIVERVRLGANRLIIHCTNKDFLSAPRKGVDKSIVDKLEPGSRITVDKDVSKVYFNGEPLYVRQD